MITQYYDRGYKIEITYPEHPEVTVEPLIALTGPLDDDGTAVVRLSLDQYNALLRDGWSATRADGIVQMAVANPERKDPPYLLMTTLRYGVADIEIPNRSAPQ